MSINDDFVASLERDIAEIVAELKLLEAGELHYSRGFPGALKDITTDEINMLRASKSNIEAVLAQHRED